MVEIVFGDSACGSLKVAQSFGKGPYPGGCTGVILRSIDKSRPPRKEIALAQQETEERARRDWEGATPMGGNSGDVYGFSLALSVGDIVSSPFGTQRLETLGRLFSVYPDDEGRSAARALLKDAADSLSAIRRRAEAGEELRIWYSSQPDELCGFYWFMDQLQQWDSWGGPVLTVQLPEWEPVRNDQLVRKNSWGDVAPGEWHRYVALQQPLTPALRQFCSSHWRELQRENAPLRAVLNGRLVSAPQTLYDSFILREIEAADPSFQEAAVVGRVLGKYQLGIGDGWVALRIEEMIGAGRLEIVTDSPKGAPVYHRILRKREPYREKEIDLS